MGNMVLIIFMSVFIITIIHCHPQNIRIPKNISPSEVNHLVEPLPRLMHNAEQQNNLEDTVEEVEEMLKANPKLPRLTRGEILDLLENITKNERTSQVTQQTKLSQASTYLNPRDPKAIMMVLPFTPDVANENNVEDLYTKPPVTQIVDYEMGSDNGALVNSELPKVQFETANKVNKQKNDTGKKYRGNQLPKTKSTSTTTSTTTTTVAPIEPSKHHFVQRKPQNHRRKTIPTSTTTTTTSSPSITTYSPRRRRPTRIGPSSSTIVTPRYPNHRYEEEISAESSASSTSTLFPSNGLKIVNPPSLPPKFINEDLLGVEDSKKEVNVEKGTPVSFVAVKDIDLSVGDDKEEDEAMPMVMEIPEHLKGVLSDLNLESAFKHKPKKHNKPRPKGTTKSTYKPTTANKEDLQLKNLIDTLELLAAQTSTTTTTTPLPDVSDVVDNLSPEMKDLLMNFGLIPNPNPPKPASDSQIYESYNPEKAEVKPDSYSGFKPLPEDDKSRDEMQELLARFGLGRSVREQKALGNKNEGSVLEMVPYEYQKILEDIGFGGKVGDSKSDALQQTLKKQHVFNPSENLYATKEEIEKLNQLSGIVKQLESLNRTVTDEDLKKIDTDTLKVLIESLKSSVSLDKRTKPLDEQEAPDPINYGYDLIRNEVKRQEGANETKKTTEESPESPTTPEQAEKSTADKAKPPSSIEEAAITEEKVQKVKPDTESVSKAPTEDETQTPNIKDLEDSFGGERDAVSESETSPPKTSPAPAPKQSGFYYLLDWNTFFDMDDQKGRRVNLRFQPKVGDPNRFYSVSVP